MFTHDLRLPFIYTSYSSSSSSPYTYFTEQPIRGFRHKERCVPQIDQESESSDDEIVRKLCRLEETSPDRN
ncbi:hypothetical protein L2E82_05968 [Cichorium intybus]|uniref:Uncharacterized protein n=1 Tax=Cichorium intybus TaxID=13427 RepID=A0ACB9H8B0_CICIN|nr:hypothetical protein L2E82_05968 [Cichorium intybus]